MNLYKNIIRDFSIKKKIYNIKLNKIIVHSGIAKNNKNKDYIKNVFNSIQFITGQKPIFSKIKKSVSNFKSKIGDLSGIYVTLRKTLMWEFYHKLICVVLPRIKEFKGFNLSKFDRFGNFNFGINDVSVFPDYYQDFKFGISINIVCSNIKNNFIDFFKIINFPIK